MRKVLVIDDERPTLSMFQLYLDAYGYKVLTADNGESGLEVFKEANPPIVLTDIKMPGIDGLEVLRRIKEQSPNTEVIVITGHGDVDLAVKALNLNATDFIDKPIRQDALEAALKRAGERLDACQANQECLSLRVEGPVAVLSLTGNIGAAQKQKLIAIYRQAAEKAGKGLLLSFSESSSLNGPAIEALGGLLAESSRLGLELGLCGQSENMSRIFSNMGLAKLAQSFPSEAEALAHFNRS